jgi:hypothetical protein
MALIVADRVQETTTTTGTGTYTLSGAKDGFQSFAAVGDGNTTYYACTDGTDYEVGIGTYTASGTTLARTTIIESSNSDAAVNWGAGSKDIFVTLPASKATFLDASGDFTLVGDAYSVTWDKSTDDLKFPAGAAAEFGDNGDLRIFVGGDGHSYISESQSGNLRIMGADIRIQSPIGEDIISGVNNGAVSLMYNGSTKVATTNTGASITGNITVTGTVDGVDIATNIPASLGTAGQVLTVNAGATAGEWADAGGSALELYAENPSSATTPSATGANAIAIGSNAGSTGTNGIAIGTGADVLNSRTDGIAIGTNAGVNGNDSIAIGEDALTSGGATAAISIGRASDARGAYSIAIGYTADAGSSSTRSTSIGYLSKSSGDDAVALGYSYVDEAGGFAAVIGNNTSAYGSQGANGVSIGLQAKTLGAQGLALGAYSQAAQTEAVALGGGYAQGVKSISIGSSSHATSTYGCAVGYDTTAVGSALALGTTANAQAAYSTAIHRSKAEQQGKIAFSGIFFGAIGDAQGGSFVLVADTTDATATVLTSNNGTASSTNQIVAASDTCITFDGTITAMQNGAQAYASWRIEGLLVNDGGTTTLANSATTVISNSSSWGMALSADNTNNALAITCTGEAAHNIRWVANIRTSEVTYA